MNVSEMSTAKAQRTMRNTPLKRPKFEDTITVKTSSKKNPPKRACETDDPSSKLPELTPESSAPPKKKPAGHTKGGIAAELSITLYYMF